MPSAGRLASAEGRLGGEPLQPDDDDREGEGEQAGKRRRRPADEQEHGRHREHQQADHRDPVRHDDEGHIAPSSSLNHRAIQIIATGKRDEAGHVTESDDEVEPDIVEQGAIGLEQAEAKALEGEGDDIGRQGQPDRGEGAPEAPSRSCRRICSPSARLLSRSSVPLNERLTSSAVTIMSDPFVAGDCPRKWTEASKRSGYSSTLV